MVSAISLEQSHSTMEGARPAAICTIQLLLGIRIVVRTLPTSGIFL